MRIRSKFALDIWLHIAADLVAEGSAFTTAMILASTSLSASTISDFMTTLDVRATLVGTLMPWTSELHTGIRRRVSEVAMCCAC